MVYKLRGAAHFVLSRPYRYSQSGLSPFLLIPVTSSNVHINAHKCSFICTLSESLYTYVMKKGQQGNDESQII